MNQLGEFIQQQMDARGWKQVDLVRASGLSKQVVSHLLRPDIELRRMISPATVTGLAQAFGKEEHDIRLIAAEAAGLPIADMPVIRTVHDEPDEVLLEILLHRTRRKGRSPHQTGGEAATNPTEAGSVAGPDGGGMVSGESGTVGDLRDPRRSSHGSEHPDNDSRPRLHAQPRQI